MSFNILICGLGSIGKRHARILQNHFPHHISALRTYQGQEKNDLNIPELKSWQEVDRSKWDVAVISGPTATHIQTALECASRGMHLFLEKPIDCKLDQLDPLLQIVEAKKLTSYVAYPLRFHPVIQELKKVLTGQSCWHVRMICTSYLPDWRPNQDPLKGYFASKEKGGGVLLELSHEMDLAQHLFGSVQKIEGCLGKKGNVTMDAEDCADLLLTQSHGVTSIHLNFLSRLNQRRIEVDTAQGCFQADFIQNTLKKIGPEGWVREFKVERDDLYLAQWNYFLQNLSNARMENNLFEAAPLFRKIVAFRERNV